MVAPAFSDANAGNIILQAAQGILANQQRAQQLSLQREQAKANLQLQFEAADARAQELDFKGRAIKLQEERLTLNKSLEGLRVQELEAKIALTRARTAGLGAGGDGGLKPPEIRQRRLTARGRLQTNQLNAAWQQFLNDRPAPTTTTVLNGRRIEVPGQGPTALTFKDPNDITALMLKLQDDTKIDPVTAQTFQNIAAGNLSDTPFFRAQREGIQRTQATMEALAEFNRRPEVQEILRGEGITEEQIQEENVRLFGGTLGALASTAAQRAAPDAVVAPTVDRAEFFGGFPSVQIDRAISLMEDGNPELMARIIRGKLANLDGPSRFQELTKLRVILETERPESGAALFKLLFNHLGGRALFDSSSGTLEPTTQGQ